MIKFQKLSGFGLIEIIVIIGVLAAFSGGGAYFLKRYQAPKGLEGTSPSPVQQAEDAKTKIERQSKQDLESSEKTQGSLQKINTSNWKTYQGGKLEFKVKYPSDWVLKEDKEIFGRVSFSSVPFEKYVHGLGIPPRGEMDVEVSLATKTNCLTSNDFSSSYDSPGLDFLRKQLCFANFFQVSIGYTDNSKEPLSEKEVQGRTMILEAIAANFNSLNEELFRETRDAQRISDLGSLKSAISLYFLTVAVPDLGSGPTATVKSVDCPFTSCVGITINNSIAIDGTGWVPINLTKTTGMNPIPLPLDPLNNSEYHYFYKADPTNLVFKLGARLESRKYRDKMINDGGIKNDCRGNYTGPNCFYEIGRKLSL